MKTLLTLAFSLSIGMAFADGKGCAGGGCCSSTYKAKAFDKKDAEFLAMANHMASAAEGKKAAGCCSDHGKKHSKKASKTTKARAH